MGIDKHIILTLERSVNRQWAALSGSVAMRTPVEKIHFVKGHDNLDYDDDMKKVARAADADGFPYSHQFAKGLKNGIIQQSASGVCQVWNYGRILREIALGTDTCLVTWDDRILTIPFPLIDKITTALQNRREEFYLWQLRLRFGGGDIWENERICRCYPKLIGGIDEAKKYLKLMERNQDIFDSVLHEKWELDFERFRKDQYADDTLFREPQRYIAQHFQKKIIGYSESMVLSPQGASWLLIQALNMKELEDDQEQKKKFYWETTVCKRSCFDTWIGADLAEDHAEKAIKDGKGIYCPKEIGYKYVHDWMPMGSSVDWANPNDEFTDNQRKKSVKIIFLDVP